MDSSWELGRSLLHGLRKLCPVIYDSIDSHLFCSECGLSTVTGASGVGSLAKKPKHVVIL